MSAKRGILIVLLVATAMSTALGDPCQRRVSLNPEPGEYGSISEALASILPEDSPCEVIIEDGTYAGAANTNLQFAGRAIILRSENGPGACTIQLVSDQQLAALDSGETAETVIKGLTVEGLHFDPDPGDMSHRGGAITCQISRPTILDCRFVTCSRGANGGAIRCINEADPMILWCEFNDHFTTGSGGAISAEFGAQPIIRNCTRPRLPTASAAPSSSRTRTRSSRAASLRDAVWTH